jgi:glutamine cyclotransferase
MKTTAWAILVLSGSLVSCSSNEKQIRSATEIPFSVQSTLPHDPRAFTQGLLIHQGELYESTGQDSSWIGVVDIRTGLANRKVVLDNKFFGEGIALLNNKVYQLTWRSKVGFVYSFPNFTKIKEFNYEGEGWGLTTDGTHLIMSNGTAEIRVLDSATLKPVRTLTVQHKGIPVTALNELEYVDGDLYANIWNTNLIARIDLESGEVTGFLDLSELVQQARRINPNADVLNGIAWHPATQTMLITGKYWPYIFLLKLK